jgi:hypothetical protein
VYRECENDFITRMCKVTREEHKKDKLKRRHKH